MSTATDLAVVAGLIGVTAVGVYAYAKGKDNDFFPSGSNITVEEYGGGGKPVKDDDEREDYEPIILDKEPSYLDNSDDSEDNDSVNFRVEEPDGSNTTRKVRDKDLSGPQKRAISLGMYSLTPSGTLKIGGSAVVDKVLKKLRRSTPSNTDITPVGTPKEEQIYVPTVEKSKLDNKTIRRSRDKSTGQITTYKGNAFQTFIGRTVDKIKKLRR